MTIKMWLWICILVIIYQKTSQSYITIIEDISVDCQPCYRRMLTSKKIMEVHIRQALSCDRIEDCYKKCNEEKAFVCAGFNFRRLESRHRVVCELTLVPYSQLDIQRDFTANPHYDYYERDLSCIQNIYSSDYSTAEWPKPFSKPLPRGQGSHSLNRGSAESFRSELRPYVSDRRPAGNDRRFTSEIPLPFDYDRQSADHGDRFLDISRPLDYNRGPVINYPRLDHDLRSDLYHRKRYLPDRRRIEGSYSSDGKSVKSKEDQFPSGGPYLLDFLERRPNFGYRPYQDIGDSEIGLYSSNRRKDWNEDWGVYGSVYGSSYGYDTNYVDKFSLPMHSAYDDSKRHEYPSLYEYDRSNGKFYNYGDTFGYQDNYDPSSKNLLRHSTERKEDCSVRAEIGVKIRKELVKKSYLTENVDQCEHLCAVEKNFFCTIFGYRYSLTVMAPMDNCLLSEVPHKDLNFYTDLEPDREYDVYVMSGNSKICNSIKRPTQHPPEECFWRVSSGFGMPLEVVKKSIFVDSLGKCEVECTDSDSFICRSFVFRYPVIDGAPNCFLSNWHTREMDDLSQLDLDGAELYERASFGRGCSLYPFPLINSIRKYSSNKMPDRKDDVCYFGYHRPCRLTSYAMLLSLRVDSESECRTKCSRMREKDPIPCMSFSYKISDDRTDDNCFMSDIPRKDLRPGLDYIYDDKHVMYAWKEFEPECIVSGHPNDHVTGYEYNFGQPASKDHERSDFGSQQSSLEVPHSSYFSSISNSGTVKESDYRNKHEHGFHRSGAPELSSDLRPIGSRKHNVPGSGSLHRSNHYHGFGHLDPDGPNFTTDIGHRENGRPDINNEGAHEYENGDFNHNHGGDRSDLSYLNELSTFQRFTVNGYPCKSGTRCERNKVAGFWSCETEGGDFDAWDYCCEPHHSCGFSRDYHYPWCYVGPAKDQWRPCKEQYYPYHSSPRPSQTLTDRHDLQHRYDKIPKQDMLGRHWPVTYLHRESPPNATDFLASANRNHAF